MLICRLNDSRWARATFVFKHIDVNSVGKKNLFIAVDSFNVGIVWEGKLLSSFISESEQLRESFFIIFLTSATLIQLFFFPALTTRLLGPYDAFFMKEGSAECINGSRNI